MSVENLFHKFRELYHHIWRKKINFIQLHYLYIGFMAFFLSGLFYCQPGSDWAYIDALFMGMSVVTNTGLNTIDMSSLSTYQMLIIFSFSILTSHVAISIVVVYVRKYYFSKRFEDVLLFNRALRLREHNKRVFEHNIEMLKQKVEQKHAGNTKVAQKILKSATMPVHLIHSATSSIMHPFRPRKRHNLDERRLAILEELQQMKRRHSITAPDATPDITVDLATTPPPRRASVDHTANNLAITPNHNDGHNILFADNVEYQREEARKELQKDDMLIHKITVAHGEEDDDDAAGNNWLQTDAEHEAAEIDAILSQPIRKYELTRKQRYCIGGAEYRAIDFLSKMIPIYYISVNVLFTFAIMIYISSSTYAQTVLQTSNPTPVNPWYFSFIICFSAFNNLGFSLLNASMVPFQNAPAPLLLLCVLIILGNTGYAIALRSTIWIIYKLLPRSRKMDRDTLRFLLDNPRRCYTTLFRSTQTWWLLAVLVGINIIESVVFITTNFWLPVVEGVSWGSRVLVGFFQGVAVRNAGFSVVNLLEVNPGTHIVYIICMYISVYPVVISIRNSNIYQERELGIYSDNNEDDEEEVDMGPHNFSEKLRRMPSFTSAISSSRKLLTKRPSFYVMTHLQRQLTHEISWLIIAIFCVCVIESAAIMMPSPITALTVIYECVSAFGSTGSSTGYPNTTTSQSAQYHTLSKVVIIILMYRGRHRGLPSAIDHAVLLPSEKLDEKEKQEQEWKKKHAEFNQTFAPGISHRRQRWRQHSSHTMV